MKYFYAHINTATNECVGLMKTRRVMERDYLIPLESERKELIGKYFYDGIWWERVWNEYETITHTEGENTWTEEVPVESSGYVDHPWTPSN